MKEILLYFFLLFIIQNFLIIEGSTSNNSKYWSTFKSIFIGIMAILPFSYMYMGYAINFSEKPDLGYALLTIFISILAFIVFFSQWIIGISFEKSAKKKFSDISPSTIKSKSFNFKPFIITIILFVITIVISYSLSIFKETTTTNNIKTNTIQYLNKKYGNSNFDIINENDTYGYSGIVVKYLTGHSLLVKSNITNNIFEVKTNKDGTTFTDNFIYCYYKNNLESEEGKKKIENLHDKIKNESSSFNNYLNNYVKVSIRIPSSFLTVSYIIDNVVPENYGKIPTIDELYILFEQYIINYKQELFFEYDELDYRIYSIDEAMNILETLPTTSKYTLSGLTVYHDNEVFKKYSSEQELLDNLIDDLCIGPSSVCRISSIPKIKKLIIEYYKNIAKHIIEYYPNIQYFELDCRCGYIVIDNNYIYINTDSNLLNKRLDEDIKIKR